MMIVMMMVMTVMLLMMNEDVRCCHPHLSPLNNHRRSNSGNDEVTEHALCQIIPEVYGTEIF